MEMIFTAAVLAAVATLLTFGIISAIRQRRDEPDFRYRSDDWGGDDDEDDDLLDMPLPEPPRPHRSEDLWKPDPDMPDGKWFTAGVVDVPSIFHYMPESTRALDAAFKADEPWLTLVREPDNPHDANAIAIRSMDRRNRIGYLPRDLAAKLAEAPADIPMLCYIHRLKRSGGRQYLTARVFVPAKRDPRWGPGGRPFD